MAVILGLNAFHPDSSACLVIDGKLVGAVAEERLGSRFKHTAAFPENAIRWLLDDAGLRLRDITHVAVARRPQSNWQAKLSHALSRPSTAIPQIGRFLSRQSKTRGIISSLAEICEEDPAHAKYETHQVEHHLAHIASAYYCSPFDELTAGFSYDGSGDFVSGMAARCEGNRIEVLDKVAVPNSMGFYYTAMCQLIGFDLFGEEYKVMGLAPYGEDQYSEEMQKIVRLDDTLWYRLDPKFFEFHRGLQEATMVEGGEMRLGQIYSDEVVKLLGPARKRSEPISQREKNIARSTQVMFERAASQCMRSLSERVPLTRLAMAGGCALNGVMNARVYRDFPVEKVYLQSASSDDGTAIGAAYHCWHMGLGKTERFEQKHSFWGPEYSDERIRVAIEEAGYTARECADMDATIATTADYIAGGAVLGWYQGRSEWGPRALGNRSILANPTIKDMKATINEKIKKRESFRPFAPSVLREEVVRFFEQDIESPFMMHVVKFRAEFREKFPAVTHVDGTGRLQTVDRENNPTYYKLISALKERTGYGIVLNTSFNENEPVVDTPAQAIACFKRTDMDVLVLGRFILIKPEYSAQD